MKERTRTALLLVALAAILLLSFVLGLLDLHPLAIMRKVRALEQRVESLERK